jgi:hypothetical protein
MSGGNRVNADFWEFVQQKKAGLQKTGELWPKLGERDFSLAYHHDLERQTGCRV